MDELQWLPTWPSQFSLLTTVALMLLSGELAARVLCPILRVPEISVHLLCGLLLGPTGVGMISFQNMPGLSELTDLTIGLVLFELARRVDLAWLLRERWALTTAIVQFVSGFLGIAILFSQLGFDAFESMIAASIGATTSPIVVLRITQETRAQGQVTERLLHAVVIQCLLGVLTFSLILQAMHVVETQGMPARWLQPAYLIAGSIGLGWAAAKFANRGFLGLTQSRLLNSTLLFSLLLILIEANRLLQLSPLTSILVFGMMLDPLRRRSSFSAGEKSPSDHLLFLFLFVSLGSTIQFQEEFTVLGTALLILIVRWAPMAVSTAFLARANGLTVKKGALLASSMLPISTVSILLFGHATMFYPQMGHELSQLLNAMLIGTYVFGSLATWWALRASGEAKPNA